MANSRYYWLLVQKLQRQLSTDEKAELQELGEKEKEPELEHDVSRIWTATGSFGKTHQPDTEAALRRLHLGMREIDAQERPSTWQVIRRPLAIAASFLLLLSAGWVWWNQSNTLGQDLVTLSVPEGQTRTIRLSDGTEVILNENTTLTYPLDFDGLESRDLSLSGEAFFKVAHRPTQAFRISTDQAKVEVLGTQFNVRAYPQEQTTEVAVSSGRVAFSDKLGAHRTELTAGEGAYLSTDGQVKDLKGLADNYYAWQGGDLYFKDTPLEEALPLLARYYQVSILWDADTFVDCPARISGDWKRDRWADVQPYLDKSAGLTLKAEGAGRYRVTGACQ